MWREGVDGLIHFLVVAVITRIIFMISTEIQSLTRLPPIILHNGFLLFSLLSNSFSGKFPLKKKRKEIFLNYKQCAQRYLILILPSFLKQLCSSKSGMFCPSRAFLVKPARTQMVTKNPMGMKIKCQATSIPADRVPDMGKRQLMNLLLLGAVSLPTGFMLVPYATFFAPPG